MGPLDVVAKEAAAEPARMDAVRRTGLLDTPAEEIYDRLTNFAATLLRVPFAVMTLIDGERQFFKSFCGPGAKPDQPRETPLSHSYCKYVVATGEPLAVTDARTDPIVQNNPATHEGVRAYLGVPLTDDAGNRLGTLCAFDTKPRSWTAEDLEMLRAIAAQIMTEIELRTKTRHLRESLEALTKAESSRRSMTRMTIHDLRTPLSSLLLCLEMLPMIGPLSESQAEYVGICVRSGQTLKSIVDSLLDIEAVALRGRAALHCGPCDPAKLAQCAMDQVIGLAQSSGLRMEKSIGDPHVRLNGDYEKLLRVLVNLLGNAIKFTRPGGRVALHGRESTDSPGFFVYSIADSGIGIHESDLEKIFEEGVLLDGNARSTDSTGLGLAYCKHIVEAHGGGSRSRAHPVSGARFRLCCPWRTRRRRSPSMETRGGCLRERRHVGSPAGFAFRPERSAREVRMRRLECIRHSPVHSIPVRCPIVPFSAMSDRFPIHPFGWFFQTLQRQSWYEPARRAFWGDPDRLTAIKATLAIGTLALPMVLLGKPFFAVSLALGALAGALSETDDHPKGRIKSMALKVVSFGISSLSVSLLHPYPVLLGLGLCLSTFGFLVIGGLSERYRGVTFGAILVGIYAMIGASISPAWYWQPILLPLGALVYGLFSLALLFLKPWRLLEEQLARGYLALARYMELKASLFPSDEKMQAKVRSQLALQNVKVVSSLDQCRDVLNSYRESLPGDDPLTPYLRYFMLLQSLHERAASSHERYELLSHDPRNRDLLEGIGQLMQQLAQAVRQFAKSQLTGVAYHHPVSLEWLVNVINDQLARHPAAEATPLPLLVRNLERCHRSLQNLSDEQVRRIAPRLARDQRTLVQRFRDQLTWNNPRMRYALRLSLCFLVGFTLSEVFDLRKGEWVVLTCLFVLQSSYSETRRRLFQRILGTFSGVVGGVVLIQLLPTTLGELVFMLVSAFAFFLWLKRTYAVSVVFITTFVLCAFNLVSHQGVALMLPRLLDTLIGSGLAYLSVRLLWPDWQYTRLPQLIDTALKKNALYLRAVIDEYQSAPTDDDLPYRIARRAAHRADNALALAWQDMQLEPKRQRQLLDQAFELTYLNHALLSYISALGAHREPGAPLEASPLAQEVLHALDEAADSINRSSGATDASIQPLLAKIREAARSASHRVSRHQLTLLNNIAEVSSQILQLSPQVRALR